MTEPAARRRPDRKPERARGRGREHSRVVRGWRLLRTARPRTFNEKVRYKMLRDRRPLLVTWADKAAVRDYLAATVGPDVLPELYAVLDDPAQLRTLELPERYVIKPTHGSGAVLAVTPDAPADVRLPAPTDDWSCRTLRPAALDPDALEALCSAWLQRVHGHGPNHEWAYSFVPPRILVEELLLGRDGGIPDDHKVFVFHGQARYVQVDTGRFGRHTQDFFDPEWRHLEMSGGLPHADERPVRPDSLARMLAIAERVGADTDFVRVDFYDLPDRLLVGELTSYPAGGESPFFPQSWNAEFGRWWTVPRRYR